MRRLLILGSGGHAGVVIEAASLNNYEIIGLIDDINKPKTIKHGYEVLGAIKDSWGLYKSFNADCIHIAVGDEMGRKIIFDRLREISGAKMLMETIIHPRGYVSHMATLGQGSFVGINAVIEANATVGDFCILRAGYIVKHDEKIKSFVTL